MGTPPGATRRSGWLGSRDMNSSSYLRNPPRYARLGSLGRVCRLGLATRDNTHLDADCVLEAVQRGINYLNWCGRRDGMSAAVRRLGSRRSQVFVAVQLEARTARAARRELRRLLGELGTDYLDVVSYYYLEDADQWRRICRPGGAAEAVAEARQERKVRLTGLTTHQRDLAASIAQAGAVELLMIRYNAAHRAAEQNVLPIARARKIPVVAYTALRWGALIKPTPDDPPGFTVPTAPEWYRFVLCHPAVSVVLMAPSGRRQLEEDLSLLDEWRGLTRRRYAELRAHGDRVHRHAGSFP